MVQFERALLSSYSHCFSIFKRFRDIAAFSHPTSTLPQISPSSPENRWMKVPEIRDFLLIITGWGESGNVILQICIAFFRELSKTFSGKDGSTPPPRKNWPVRLCK